MKAGDKIRIISYWGELTGDSEDFIVEEFRYCLGIFKNDNCRTAQVFTPLCDLYETGPNSKTDYISNFGDYQTEWVQAWCDIPKE